MRVQVACVILIIIIVINSCGKDNTVIDDVPYVLSGDMIGLGVIKGWLEGRSLQGCAIRDNVIYVARNGGVCDKYSLEGDLVNYLSSFPFQSRGEQNHANCIQFDPTILNSSILYISSHIRSCPCYVETITSDGSELTQTVYIEEMEEVPKTMYINLIPGDDGYLWLCGFYDTTLRIIKFKKPDLTTKEVTLGKEDIVDSWYRSDYVWEQEVLQGMKMYNNTLYVVYGGSYNKRGIWVWDTNTHMLKNNIDFTNVTTDEFEDVDIYKGHLFLFVLKDYIMKFTSPDIH